MWFVFEGGRGGEGGELTQVVVVSGSQVESRRLVRSVGGIRAARFISCLLVEKMDVGGAAPLPIRLGPGQGESHAPLYKVVVQHFHLSRSQTHTQRNKKAQTSGLAQQLLVGED